mgnify:CR=1 FL=1
MLKPLRPRVLRRRQHVLVVEGEDCAEEIPSEVNHSSLRITLGSAGYGLIEAIKPEDILQVQSLQPVDVRGIVHWIQSIEDEPESPPRIGRFGWKAQEATILAFSAKAASDEMGVTTWLVQEEPPPNGDMEQLLLCDDVPDPETGIEVEGFDYLSAITDFQRFMAPPPRAPATRAHGTRARKRRWRRGVSVPSVATSCVRARFHQRAHHLDVAVSRRPVQGASTGVRAPSALDGGLRIHTAFFDEKLDALDVPGARGPKQRVGTVLIDGVLRAWIPSIARNERA